MMSWDSQIGVKETVLRTSQWVQWLSICLAMQGTQVRFLVRELSSHILRATNPMPTRESMSHNERAPSAATKTDTTKLINIFILRSYSNQG